MTKGRKRKSGPTAQTDDQELWSQVAATVTPLRRRPGESPIARPMVPDACTPDAPAKSSPKSAKKPAVSVRPAAPSKPVVSRPAAPALTGLDRRTSQKFARGNADIEARIDLHGMGRENARTALKNFIITSRSAGRRTVLAITGKGYSPYSSHTLHGYEHVNTPERQGVIRRSFPQWLNEPEFRAHVAGYQPAHPRHGGGGAFYIRLRRPKD